MSASEKLVKIHDINNMEIFIANHFKKLTHASTNERHKTIYDVIAPPTNNIDNGDGSLMNEVSSIQANYYKNHIDVSNLLRPSYVNLKHENLKNNVELDIGREELEKYAFLDARDKVVSSTADFEMQVVQETFDLSNHRQ